MKRILCFLIIICYASGVLSFSSSAESMYVSGKYTAEFEEYLANNKCYPSYKGEENWYMYNDSYYDYFSATNDTSTPDWLLAWGSTVSVTPMSSYGVFGDYYITDYNCLNPYELGYLIYVPCESKFYTLEEAWIAQLEGIECAFSECLVPLGEANIIGDTDGDRQLTIMDATFIQCALSGICEFNSYDNLTLYNKVTDTEPLLYASDMDRDGERTILDATAIQLKLAGLSE